MEKKLFVPELGANVAYDDSWPSDYVQQMVARLIQEKGVKAAPQPKPETNALGHLWEAQKGVWSGAAQGIAAVPSGLGGILDNQTLKDIGETIRNNRLTENFKANPGYEDSIARQGGEIAGNLATMLGPGMAANALKAPALLARLAGPAMGMLQGSAEQVQRAQENRAQGMNVTPEEETSAARWGTAPGLLEFLPAERLLGRLAPKGLNMAREAAESGLRKQASRAIGTGLIEAPVETLQNYLQNQIEGRYNEQQDPYEGTVENFVGGFGAGAVLEALAGVRARRVGKDVMSRRERVPSQPVAPLTGVDSVAVRSGEGGDPLIELLAGMTPEQPTRPMVDMPRGYNVPKKEVATPPTPKLNAKQQAELDAQAYNERMQQLIPDTPMPVEMDALPMEDYGQKAKQAEVPPPSVNLDDIAATQQAEIDAKPQPVQPETPLYSKTATYPDVKLTDEGTIAEPSKLAMDQPGAPRFSIESPTKQEWLDETFVDKKFSKAGSVVDGRAVRPDTPNMGSIDATFDDYEVLPGVREIPLSEFEAPPSVNKRTKGLAEEISNSKEINPLIVAIDDQGPYILEGAHRYDALKIMGAKSFPAVVVVDKTAPSRYSIAGKSPTTPTPTTYTVNGLRQEIEAGTKPQIALDVFAEMKALGVDDLLSTRLIDNIPNAQGSYADRVVQLALNGKSKADLLRTLNHESVHGMKQMGLFNDAEWKILNKSFNPNTSLTPQEKEQYMKLYSGNTEMVNEEAVARGIEKYAAGQINETPEAVSIVGKVLGTVDRLGNVLRGKGFQNTNDVLQSFRTGDIGSRPANLPPPPPAPRTLKEYEKTAYGTSKIPNGQTNQPVFQSQENVNANTVNGRSTELGDYLTEDQAPEAAGEVERKSVIPQLPVEGGTVFAKPDERSRLQKTKDAFIREDKLGGIGLKLRQNILDMWAGVAELGYKAGDTTARSGSEAAVRNADASIDMAAAGLTNGAVKLIGTPGNGYFKASGDSKNAPAVVFKEAYENKKLDQLFHYLAASRGEKLLNEGREKKITPQQIAAWTAYGRDPQIADYAKRWKAFNDEMVDTWKASGYLDAETAAKFKKDLYLPFYRVADDGEANFPSSGSTMASTPRIERLKGSELEIADPTDNIVRNVNMITSMAMKNVAMQRVARDGLKTGYIKQVPKPVPGKPNMKVWVDGKEKHFEVLDPILYASITSSRLPSSTALKVAAFPSNALRFMVTHDPVFMINNPVRDSTMAWLQGYTDFPMQQILQSAAAAIKNRPSFQSLEKLGIVGGGIRGEGGAASTGSNLRSLYAGDTGLKGYKNKLDKFSNKSEGLTRDTVYRAVMERTGGDEAQAQYEARELLNFGRRGNNKAVQLVNALIPFQNAAWQGADVLYRAGVKGRGANPQMQKQLGTRMATMAALSALYSVAASQMPAWQNATDEERDANWFIPMTNGEAFKVKIPFEAGYIAKVVPERLVAMYMGHDTGREFLGAFDRFLKSTIKMDVVPQAIKPYKEVASNFSDFRGKAIEPEYMRDREKSQRFDENTSELAKKIGEHTDQLSPLQIDHLLRGYGGALGIYGTQLLSLLANPDKAAASLSMDEKMPHDLPVFGRFFQREDSGKELATYYETTDKGVQAKNALKAGLEPTDERVNLAQYEKAQSPIYKRIQAINKQEKLLREAMNTGAMDPGDARAMLRDYREAKLELARQANELSRGLR